MTLPRAGRSCQGRAGVAPFFCHKSASHLFPRPVKGKENENFGSKERGKGPVTFSFNEQGKMPECRECDGVCPCFWLCQTDFEALVGILAPSNTYAPFCGVVAEESGNGKSPHAMEQCLGNRAFTVPSMCVVCSKVQPKTSVRSVPSRMYRLLGRAGMRNGSVWRTAPSAQKYHSMVDSRLRRITGNLLQPNGGDSQRGGGGELQTYGFKLGSGTDHAGRGLAPCQKRSAERVCNGSELVLYETQVSLLHCIPRLGAKSLFGLVCEDGFRHRGEQRHHNVEHKNRRYRGNGIGFACCIRTWFRSIRPWGHGDLCKLVSTQLAGVMECERGKAYCFGLNLGTQSRGEAQVWQ